MQFSKKWLQEWLNAELDTEELVHKLTMAGLEIDSATPVAAQFNKIVVGHVVATEKHPDADKLTVCKVDVGEGEPLQIICGASNVRQGLKVAAAVVGAKIEPDFKIKKAKLRGVESYGMLCSEKELGIAESSAGIMELPADAPIGADVRHYLSLDDVTIDIDLTPNRGDCLGLEGLARETSALCKLAFKPLAVEPVKVNSSKEFPVTVRAPADCPRYVGRVISGVDVTQASPLWLTERLRRSGIRSIDAVVDVTNYVLLELGHPLHAFDLAQLEGGIQVRKAEQDEVLTLLDEQEIKMDPECLVIADENKALALAGIMGGIHSGVSPSTKDLFLESAFFAPHLIAGRARRFGLHTDASHRYERGVDYNLQHRALERATELLLDIVGGEAGPISEFASEEHLPKPVTVKCRKARVDRILGVAIPAEEITEILLRLGLDATRNEDVWEIKVPSFRFDITIEEDIIEEIGRIYGYDNIPTHHPAVELRLFERPERSTALRRLRDILITRDYHEVITYSFVDQKTQSLLNPKMEPISLLNPISKELSQMRTSLWPGLLNTFLYNQNRQQTRVRIFETGLYFREQFEEIKQEAVVAGLVAGSVEPEQWATPKRPVDFYDVKGDVEAILSLAKGDCLGFEPLAADSEFTAALHPGQSAKITKNQETIGYVGALHPSVAQKLGINNKIYLFELNLKAFSPAKLPKFAKLSKYPAIRRDLAFLVNGSVDAMVLENTVKTSANDLLVDLKIFDVYQEAADGKKSIALALTLQHPRRTLVDEEVNSLVESVVTALKTEHSAILRD